MNRLINTNMSGTVQNIAPLITAATATGLPATPALAAYLETEACRTVVSNQLSEIKDLAGGFTFSQATASFRPDYDGSVLSTNGQVGAYFENSRAALTATATNNFISATDGQTLAVVLGSLTPNISIYNKLNEITAGEVPSTVGSNFTVVGTPTLEACKYGNGIDCGGSNNLLQSLNTYNAPFYDFSVEFWWKPDQNWNTNLSPGEAHYVTIGNKADTANFIRIKRNQDGNYQWRVEIKEGNAWFAIYVFSTTTTFSAGDLLHIGVTLAPTAAAGNKIKFYVNGTSQALASSSTDTDWSGQWTSIPYDILIGHNPYAATTATHGPVGSLRIHPYIKPDFPDDDIDDIYASTIFSKWNYTSSQMRYMLNINGYGVASDCTTYDANEVASFSVPAGMCDIIVAQWNPGVHTKVWVNDVLAGTATSPAATISGTVNQITQIGARSNNANSLQPADVWAILAWPNGKYTSQQLTNIYNFLKARYID